MPLLDQPLREAREAFERLYFEHNLKIENGNMTRVAERTGHAVEQLTGLALVVLPRKEKGPRRAVLKALAKLDAPPAALLETVEALSNHSDSVTADLARSLLRHWKS